MIVNDRIYGAIEIQEPLIIELISCAAMQRLKDIDQAGYFTPHFPGSKHTRFEHSVGVYCLLKRFRASLQEQIAGLIHDVSHSVFSHCIDYILEEGSQAAHSHQDNIFSDYVKKTEIPKILNKYGYSLDYILDDNNFPLKEKPLPDLCADRIDYALRSAVAYGLMSPEKAQRFLHFLSARSDRWVFLNETVAKSFAQLFLKLNAGYFAGLPSVVMYNSVGETVKHALKRKYIAKKDLYTTDSLVLRKINRHLDSDKRLRILCDRMNNKIACCNSQKDYQYKVVCKSRVIDPWCIFSKTKIVKVSDIDEKYREILKKQSKPKVYYLRYER